MANRINRAIELLDQDQAIYYTGVHSFSRSFLTYEQDIPGSKLSIPMVLIKGGEFKMGSPKSEKGRNEDEGPIHPVMVDDFWMSNLEKLRK